MPLALLKHNRDSDPILSLPCVGPGRQDKIYDESWEQYRLADWNRYTLMAEGVNVTGVTHLHYESSYTVGLNETYPYHYIGLLPVSFQGGFSTSAMPFLGHVYL